MPRASTLIGDKGYDSDKWRAALKAKGIDACILPKSNCKTTIAATVIFWLD
ncbi:transposase [Roseibium sp. SCP15]|uniref:transposase n=1 Tax=Roseibium sp. SCP15 TaxID=3141376 RepID=UPI00333A11D2